MSITVNGTTYPLRGWTDPAEYSVIGHLSSCYYLCRDKDGNEFALYLPNMTEYYPAVC